MILCITSGSFSQLLAVPYHIQNVILDLECNADIVGTQFQCRNLFIGCPCQRSSDSHGRLDQGCRLVGMDEQGEAKYAFLRGIYDSRGKSFRMEQEGSNKQYSFCVPPLGKSHRVAVYEACIDALAHMTLEDGRTDKYRLSLGGIAAPKEGAERATKKMKRPDALEYFLKEHPEVTEIELCTDNDFAGRWACAQLKEQYEEKYTVVCNLPQMEGADYGDLAKQAVEKQKKQQKERGR